MRKCIILFKVTILFVFFNSGTVSAWTISADFEGGVVGQRAQGTSGFQFAGTATTYSSDVVYSGTKSAKIAWTQGSEGWGVSHGEFTTLPTTVTEGQEIWVRGYYYFASPWAWNSGQMKVLRIGTNYSNGSGSGWLSILEDGGNITFSNEPALIQTWAGTQTGVAFDINKWQCLEIYVKFSTSDPIFRVWKNGALVKEDRTLPVVRQSGNYIDRVLVDTIWNTPYAPQNQTQYVDNIIITTDRPSQTDSNGNVMIGTGVGSGNFANPNIPAPAALKVTSP